MLQKCGASSLTDSVCMPCLEKRCCICNTCASAHFKCDGAAMCVPVHFNWRLFKGMHTTLQHYPAAPWCRLRGVTLIHTCHTIPQASWVLH